MDCFALFDYFNSFLLDSSCSAFLLFYISTQHTCGFCKVKNLLSPKVLNKKGADHLIVGDRLHPFFLLLLDLTVLWVERVQPSRCQILIRLLSSLGP